MSEFKREDRYVILKRRDVNRLPHWQKEALREILTEIENIMPPREYVVVESDWPEYEAVWEMIQARVEGRPNRIAELEGKQRWHYPAHNLDVPNLPEPGQKVVAYYRSGDRICGPVVMGDLNRDDGPPTIAGKSIYQPVVRWCAIPAE